MFTVKPVNQYSSYLRRTVQVFGIFHGDECKATFDTMDKALKFLGAAHE